MVLVDQSTCSLEHHLHFMVSQLWSCSTLKSAWVDSITELKVRESLTWKSESALQCTRKRFWGSWDIWLNLTSASSSSDLSDILKICRTCPSDESGEFCILWVLQHFLATKSDTFRTTSRFSLSLTPYSFVLLKNNLDFWGKNVIFHCFCNNFLVKQKLKNPNLDWSSEFVSEEIEICRDLGAKTLLPLEDLILKLSYVSSWLQPQVRLMTLILDVKYRQLSGIQIYCDVPGSPCLS